jgi:Skp family chaperone for outer membrane proteins
LGWRGIFTHPVGAGYNPDAPIGANAKNKYSTDILQLVIIYLWKQIPFYYLLMLYREIPPISDFIHLGEQTVKQIYWMTFFVALMIVGGFISQAAAQEIPNLVAVVDVAQLIKEHPEFQAKQENLQKQIQAEDAKFRNRQQQIVEKEKTLQNSAGFKSGTEHQKLIDEIAEEYADFAKDGDVKAMQRKFALENSKIMHETYLHIKKVIGDFAKQRRIVQVMDYRFLEVDPAEPQLVTEDRNQSLVWFDERLNITECIIDAIYADLGKQRPPRPPQHLRQYLAQPQKQVLSDPFLQNQIPPVGLWY